jgi:hypothetical protein
VVGRRNQVYAAPDREVDVEVCRGRRRFAGCVVMMDCRDEGSEAVVFVDAPSEFCFGACSRQSRWTGPKAEIPNHHLESFQLSLTCRRLFTTV